MSTRRASGIDELDQSTAMFPAERGLAEALSQIVNDPARVDALHTVLGPFCHQSRNILNSLKLSLYLVQRTGAAGHVAAGSGDWRDVEQQYRAVEGFYDRLQMIWRPVRLAPVRASLALLMDDRERAWLACFAHHGRALEIRAVGKTDPGDFDPSVLGAALDGFVGWRASAGVTGGKAELRWGTSGGRFHLEWIEPEATECTAAAPAGGSARTEPLALPLLGRVLAAHGGVWNW